MESYRDLIVWQRSIELVTEIYTLTSLFPKNEQFGLVSQMRRAAVSIPANLAEGYARKHRKEYLQFVRIAYGSGAELETFFVIIDNLGFVTQAQAEKARTLLDETMRMLNKFSSSLVATP
jgi:four helix bundle protein